MNRSYSISSSPNERDYMEMTVKREERGTPATGPRVTFSKNKLLLWLALIIGGVAAGTTKWTLPEFRHPSSASQSCAQCHQAPPSHSMMHFQMISMKVACQPKAKVNQCFLCHQTTSWNDIKGVGFYKHH